MKTHAFTVLAATAAAGGLMLGAAPAAFADTCDAYSGQCPTVQPTTIHRGGGTGGQPGGTPPGTTVEGTRFTSGQLPFTGGEIALMSIAGAAALGAGSVLVVGARRRRTPAA